MALVRMKAPDWLNSISIAGVLLEIKKGFVEVEEEFVAEAQAHGLMLKDDAGLNPAWGEKAPAAADTPKTE
ncbi:hypothetical protein [Burkholderia sp. LMG 21824]|uniref:hypothetical protein n=1 Tax=Burkholderia sp. LMG 21824 TaxID=3158172 RepID=UPI003C2C3DD4